MGARDGYGAGIEEGLMKRILLPAALAVAAFAVIYILLCCLPGLRIKLAADALTYFVESVRHMFLFKTVISGAVAAAVGIAAYRLTRGSEV